MTRGPKISLQIPESAWEENGSINDGDDPRSCLLAWIEINGVSFHAEAIELAPTDEDGIRHAVNAEWESHLDAMTTINGEGDFNPVMIAGREYAVSIIPFSG